MLYFYQKRNSFFTSTLLVLMMFFMCLQSTFAQGFVKPITGHDHHNCSRHTMADPMYGRTDAATGKTELGIEEKDGKLDASDLFKNFDDCPDYNFQTLTDSPADIATLISILKLPEWTGTLCLEEYFEYQPGFTDFIYSAAKAEAVANEVLALSYAYAGNNNQGMFGLLSYLHGALHHNFKTPSINYFSYEPPFQGGAVITELQDAITALLTRIHTIDSIMIQSNQEHFDILNKALILASEPLIRTDQEFQNFANQAFFNMTSANWIGKANDGIDWNNPNDQRTLITRYVYAYLEIFNVFFRSPQDTEWATLLYPTANPTLARLAAVAIDSDIQQASQVEGAEALALLQINTVRILAKFAETEDPIVYNAIQPHLLSIIDFYEVGSPEWNYAMIALNTYGDCNTFLDEYYEHPFVLRSDLIDQKFPRNDIFEDGKIEIRSSLSDEEIMELYHSSNQVRAQVFRLIGDNQPVAGDQGETLKIFVFSSQSEYHDFGSLLFNIDTNNGGMYLEPISTFFTWDRTVGLESSLSLQELFRHEYCHYLQGRYIVPGSWGDPTFYEDSRLVWFEEGMANFLAGSTDTDGVKLLRTTAMSIEENGPQNLNTVFNASYTGNLEDHYIYASSAWMNWYLNDYTVANELIQLIRNSEVANFDAYVEGLRYDDPAVVGDNYDASYQAYLDFVVSDREGASWEPETEWAYDNQISIADVNQMANLIVSNGNLNNLHISTTPGAENPSVIEQKYSDSYARFVIEGELEVTLTSNSLTDATLAISTKLDALLEELRAEFPLVNNLNYTVGYFKDVTVFNSPSFFARANFFIEGPLGDSSMGNTVVADFTASTYEQFEMGDPIILTNTSTGLLTGISWFLNGAILQENDEPVISISTDTPGSYTVKLRAFDALGGFVDVDKMITIHAVAALTNSYCIPSTTNYEGYVMTLLDFAGVATNSDLDYYSTNTTDFRKVIRGSSIDMTINQGGLHVVAWIDFNRDGVFTQSEIVFDEPTQIPTMTKTVNVPANASLGVAKMRIISYGNVQANPDPCITGLSGEIEDYNVLIANPTTSQAPVVSLLKPTLSDIEFETGDNIAVEAIVTDDGQVVEAALEVDGVIMATDENAPFQFTGIVALNNLSVGAHVLTVTVTDNHGMTASVSHNFTVVAGDDYYCEASNSSNADGGTSIFGVEIGPNFSNYTGPSTDGGYSDFTALTATIPQGATTELLMDLGHISESKGYGVWVDWNNDGDFFDKDDFVGDYYGISYDANGDTSAIYQQEMIPPVDAVTNVPLLMRIRSVYSGGFFMEPCGNGGSGQTEDYTVILSDSPVISCFDDLDITASNSNYNVEFYSNADNAASYSWTVQNSDINGGAPLFFANQQNDSYNFTGLGTYEICLTVADAAGCIAEKCETLKLLSCHSFIGFGSASTPIVSVVPNFFNGVILSSNQLSGLSSSNRKYSAPTVYAQQGPFLQTNCVKVSMSKTDLEAVSQEIDLSLSPNPFDYETDLSFELFEDALVTIDVYSISGAQVLSVTRDKEFSAGTNKVTIQRGDLQSGIYIVTVQSEKFAQTVKLMVK